MRGVPHALEPLLDAHLEHRVRVVLLVAATTDAASSYALVARATTTGHAGPGSGAPPPGSGRP